MARLGQKPNGIYFLDVTVPAEEGGTKRQRVSCNTRDRDEAKKQLRDWEIGAHPLHYSRGAVVAPKGRSPRDNSSVKEKSTDTITMAKLFDMCHSDRRCWRDVKSQPTIRSNIRLLNERIGSEPITNMTHKRLCALADELLDEGYAPGAAKRKMDMISKALRMAVTVYENEDGTALLAGMPVMPRITVKNQRSRVLKPKEETLVFAAIDARLRKEPTRKWDRFRLFIRILIDTGMRRGEVLQLGPDSLVHLDAPSGPAPFLALEQYKTKNEKPRLVPATSAVVEMVPALNAGAVDGCWFPEGRCFWYMWSNIRDDVKKMGANIDDVTLHTLRHTCITRLATGGLELQRLSMWAGHSSVAITAKRYSHLQAQHLLDGVSILDSNPPEATTKPSDDSAPEKANYHVNGGNRANRGTVSLQ